MTSGVRMPSQLRTIVTEIFCGFPYSLRTFRDKLGQTLHLPIRCYMTYVVDKVALHKPRPSQSSSLCRIRH